MKTNIVLCAIAEPEHIGVVENYELSRVYGLEYIRKHALTDPEIRKRYKIEICAFSQGIACEEIIDTILSREPELIGFTCSLKNFLQVLDVTRQIKLASPGVDIIYGGPEVFEPQRLMERFEFIDFAVAGEGEETFRDFLKSRMNGSGPRGVAGLSYRRSGKPVHNPPRPPIADLDSLPRLISNERVSRFSGVCLYETSRGCRHCCTYCLWSPYPKRYFSLRRVKKDLKILLSNKNISRIFFIDSDFDSDSSRAVEILRYVKKNNHHGAKVSAFLSFLSDNEELLSLMGELCHEVPVGLQTLDKACLKALGRPWFNITNFERRLPLILRHIEAEKLYIDLMYGLPHETPSVFLDTLMWCVAHGLTHINFFRLGLYPGAPLEKESASHGYIYDPDPPHLVYSSRYFTYDDLLIIENVIVNFKLLTRIFGPAEMIALNDMMDLRRAVKELHLSYARWETCFRRVNESNIADVDIERALPHILDYIESNIPAVRDFQAIKRMAHRATKCSHRA